MLRLTRLNITPHHCKSRHPQHKPFIERLNRALKRALQRLPGSTRFNGKDGGRDPVALGDKLMTLEELEAWIVKWYYQKWAKKVLVRHVWSDFHDREKLGITPEQRWVNFGKRGYPRRLSPPLSSWHMTLYEHHEATLNRKTGLTYLRFSYRGPNLKYLIQNYGEVKVKFMFDPDDYRQVFVYDGEGMPLVPLVERYAAPETRAADDEHVRRGARLKPPVRARRSHP
jgi:putative transposase